MVCAGDVGGGHVVGDRGSLLGFALVAFFGYFPFVWSSGSGHIFK